MQVFVSVSMLNIWILLFFFFKECYELNASVPQDFYIEILSSNLIIRGWGLWDVIRSWKLSLYDWALMVMISRDLGCSLRWPWIQSPPISACWFLVLQRGPPHQKIHRFFLFCSGRDWTWNWCLSEWGFREPLCSSYMEWALPRHWIHLGFNFELTGFCGMQ